MNLGEFALERAAFLIETDEFDDPAAKQKQTVHQTVAQQSFFENEISLELTFLLSTTPVLMIRLLSTN